MGSTVKNWVGKSFFGSHGQSFSHKRRVLSLPVVQRVLNMYISAEKRPKIEEKQGGGGEGGREEEEGREVEVDVEGG